MTAAVLISMIFSFFVGQPGDLIPNDPAKRAQQFIETLENIKLEITQGCPRSFNEFIAVRSELKKDDGPRNIYSIN